MSQRARREPADEVGAVSSSSWPLLLRLERRHRVEQNGGEIIQGYRNFPIVAARLPPEAVASLIRHSLVNYIEPNERATVHAQDTTWGAVKIHAPEGWSSGYKGNNTHVTILDTGIGSVHVFDGDVDINRLTDCGHASAYDNCWDDAGHGTHMYGTIAADDNEIGVIGVAPQALVASIKVWGA